MTDDRVSYTDVYQRFQELSNPPQTLADTNGEAFQNHLTSTLQLLQQAIKQRQLDGLLSENERFFELHNTQLYAFCLEYYMGMLLPKRSFFQQSSSQQQSNSNTSPSDPTNDHTRNVLQRIRYLRDADVFLTEFLDRAERMGILTETKRREQYERMDAKKFLLSRDEKIQRFKMQREMEKKLELVQQRRQQQRGTQVVASGNGDNEDEEDDDMDELEREQLMAFIQLAVIKTMEEQSSINQERDMLETMAKMNAASEKKDLFTDVHRPPPPPQGQGITVTHINPQFEMRKETIRSQVFQPGHRLPTMSLQEYADREVADAMERQKREQEAPQAPRRYDQLVEDGDEDDHKLIDEATYKDRAWDDWKDANPKEDAATSAKHQGMGDASTTDDAALDALLEEFYDFTYEQAVLTEVTGGSPPKYGKDKRHLPTRVGSPKHGSSPRKYQRSLVPSSMGPSATQVPANVSLTPPNLMLTREIMNALLPPKTWRDTNGKWQRMVRMTPATRVDVIRLQELLDCLLREKQARAQAICPVREKYFLHIFEELIRQVTCECPEQGLLLLRVRDELRLTIQAYQTLYHNSISYGRKKAVQAEAGIAELEAEIHRLEEERQHLLVKKRLLTHKALRLEEQEQQQQQQRALHHEQTLQFLHTQRQEMELFYRELTMENSWK